MINDDFQGKVSSWRKDSCGRVLSLGLEIAGVTINVINIYAPTNQTERKIFFENLHEFFIPSDELIIGGDFNCYEKELDKFGGNISLATYLTNFRSSFRLVDIWRKRHLRAREMSWFNADLSIGSRLDKFFASGNLVDFVDRCEISPCCLSDHDYVNLSIRLDTLTPRGPGIWKFNNSLLDDELFCAFVTHCIEDLTTCKASFDSVTAWWDFFKTSLKGDILGFAREKRKRLHHERVSLTNRIAKLKRQLVQGFPAVSREIIFLESSLAALTDHALNGIKTRSQAQWLEEGEKPSRYFFKLEKERIAKSEVKLIYNSDGAEVSTREELEQAHIDFYSDLFTAEPIDPECQAFLLSEVHNSLPDSEHALCEGPGLSPAELTSCLKTPNAHKAPGPDGFIVEFYVKFWKLLGPLLSEVITKCFEEGNLCESMKSSATRLIFKK